MSKVHWWLLANNRGCWHGSNFFSVFFSSWRHILHSTIFYILLWVGAARLGILSCAESHRYSTLAIPLQFSVAREDTSPDASAEEEPPVPLNRVLPLPLSRVLWATRPGLPNTVRARPRHGCAHHPRRAFLLSLRHKSLGLSPSPSKTDNLCLPCGHSSIEILLFAKSASPTYKPAAWPSSRSSSANNPVLQLSLGWSAFNLNPTVQFQKGSPQAPSDRESTDHPHSLHPISLRKGNARQDRVHTALCLGKSSINVRLYHVSEHIGP